MPPRPDPTCTIGFDLADSSGYAYYSGARFAVYAEGASDAIARGGRYDEVGAIFGRNRPAVGFGLDVKEVAELVPRPPAPGRPIRAPGSATTPRCAARCATCAQRGEIVVARARRRADADASPRPQARRVGRPLDRRAALSARARALDSVQ